MGVDGVNFLTDGIHRTTQFRLGTLILLNGRLQFKCGIDEGVCSLVNVLTQLLQLRNTVYKPILGLLLLNLVSTSFIMLSKSDLSSVSMFILLFLIAILSLIYRWKLLLRGLGLHME